MWEEIVFVVEGSGYDLHWDMRFRLPRCHSNGSGSRIAEEVRVERGRLHLHPAVHHVNQHFATAEARLIMMGNRMVKEMGYDWFDPGGERSGIRRQQSVGRPVDLIRRSGPMQDEDRPTPGRELLRLAVRRDRRPNQALRLSAYHPQPRRIAFAACTIRS